jgi:hypothetical protein
MLRKAIVGLMMLVAVGLASGPVFAADPTLHDVYQAAEAGKLTEAQAMIDQVLRDHPSSAKAHYVEAELLAKQGRFTNAQAELRTAERLAPGLPFAKPQAVQELRARISPSHGFSQPNAPSAQARTGNGMPWGLLLLGFGGLAFIFFVARWMSRRSPMAIPGGSGGYGSGGTLQPYGTGAPPMGPTGGGIGSGILGGLATGAAVGAGVVAGEALMHHLTDGHGSRAIDVPPTGERVISSTDDMGGRDFGISDNDSWDDSSGGGGDDWT